MIYQLSRSMISLQTQRINNFKEFLKKFALIPHEIFTFATIPIEATH